MKKIILSLSMLSLLANQTFAMSTRGKITVVADLAGGWEGGKTGLSVGSVTGGGAFLLAGAGAIIGAGIGSGLAWWVSGIIKPLTPSPTIPDQNNPFDYVGAKHNSLLIDFSNQYKNSTFNAGILYDFIISKGINNVIDKATALKIANNSQTKTSVSNAFEFVNNLTDKVLVSKINPKILILNSTLDINVTDNTIKSITIDIKNSTLPENDKNTLFATFAIMRYSAFLWEVNAK